MNPPKPNATLSWTPGGSAARWSALLEAVGPAGLLVVIESRMSPELRRRCPPEELLQEVLLRAWRDRDSAEFDSVRAFRSWLLTAIDRRIADTADSAYALKRGGRTPPQSLEEVTDAPETITPSRVLIYREQAQAMRRALDALPADVREIVRLRLFEHLELRAVADHVGLSIPAVRHRLRAGAIQYQRLLRQERQSSSDFGSTPALRH